VPLSALNAHSDFTIAEHPPAKPEERPGAQQRWIGPHYFRTMGIPLRAGRDIAESDRADTQLVAVIDEVLARQFWSGDPIGDHLELDDSAGRRVYEIVAVAASVRHFTLDEQPLGTLYMPYTQIMPDVRSFFAASASLVVRTKITPLTLVSRVRTELRRLMRTFQHPKSAPATPLSPLHSDRGALRFRCSRSSPACRLSSL
jgi:putative ABC transport system permease protein